MARDVENLGKKTRSHNAPIAAAIGGGGLTTSDASDDLSPDPIAELKPLVEGRPARITVVPGLGMDPRLQRLIALRQGGESTPATASSVPGEIPVVALVKDFKAWEELSEVREPGIIAGGAELVVTGRIPLSRVESIRALPFILSLKAARPLKPMLEAGVRETRATAADLGDGLKAVGGKGTVVGVIDFGCDFAHANFRERNGTTRIEAIWHQGGQRSASSPFGYGRLFERNEIDLALRQPSPYPALGYGPAKDTAASQGTHGTHVMDIAAGNGAGSGTAGFAPEASIVFVDVSSEDIAWSGPEVVGISFGDSVRLLEAARFIFDRAGDRPCVINVSLGTNGGPHDGTTLVERGLDELVRQAPNRAVVIAASNSYSDGIHASGKVVQGQSLDVDWTRPPGAGWQDELEVWYDGQDAFDTELFMPDGTSLGLVKPGENGEARDDQHRIAVLVSSRESDPTNGANMIGIYVRDGMPDGRWRVRLHGRQVAKGGFHAWIERDDSSQASFFTCRDDDYTVGSISCGWETVVVASYDAHKASTPLSYFSSAGPTRDGRNKPDLAAPGHAVLAAHSRTGKDVTVKSGTSMAAPAVTGAIALLLAEAKARGLSLTAAETRELLLENVRKPQGQKGWDRRWGSGRLDVAAAMAALPTSAAAATIASLENERRAPTLVKKPARAARARST